MRFAALRQVEGPIWVIYDTLTGEIVHAYTDKYAKEVATELCDLLNRGDRAKNEEITLTQNVPSLSEVVQSRKGRFSRVRHSVQGSKEEVK